MSDINIKKALFEFLKENKKSIFGYLFFSLAVPISNIYLPHLYGKIISAINDKKIIDKRILYKFSIILALWLLIQSFWSAMNAIDAHFIPKLRKFVREYIVDKVITTYKENYEEKEVGGIIAEIVKLPDEVEHLFTNIRNHLLPISFLIVFSVGYFMWISPIIGIASIVSIGVYLSIAYKFSKRCIPIWKEMNIKHKKLHDNINDVLTNLLNIYITNGENIEKERLKEHEDEFTECHGKTIKCAGNFRLLLNLSYIFLFCSLNLLSFYLYSRKLVTLDSVVSILIISLELISKMAGFIGSVDRMLYELSVINNIQQLVDNLNTKNSKNSKTKIHGQINNVNLYGPIEFLNISTEYDNHYALKDINIRLEPSSKNVIIGEIGSGKTSLINVLMRLIPFDGKILINGYDTKNLDLAFLRSNILYIPQNPKLFNRSILDNILYGNNATRKQVEDTLQKYGINIELDKKAGKFGSSLSGGQRQIVYLLRCLFKNVPIILLDEPTASLDTETKSYILKIIWDLQKNKTVIMVSHDKDVLVFADRIIELNNGKLRNTS